MQELCLPHMINELGIPGVEIRRHFRFSIQKSAILAMTQSTNIVVLTGAGISQESGLPTFLGADGLWNGHRVEEVASPVAFRRDPNLVHDFYDSCRRVEINLDDTAIASVFHETIRGQAATEVPAYCQKLRAMYPLNCSP